jgi:hypothetical protein
VCSWVPFIGPRWPIEAAEDGRRRRPVVALISSVLSVSHVKHSTKGEGNGGGRPGGETVMMGRLASDQSAAAAVKIGRQW